MNSIEEIKQAHAFWVEQLNTGLTDDKQIALSMIAFYEQKIRVMSK